MSSQFGKIAMPDITFCTAWRKSDVSLARGAKTFWNEIGVVMTPDEMEQRASELCALAYSGGKVVAVSTAAPFDYLRLRSRFAYYRTTIAPEFRRQRLAARLCVYSRDRLAEWAHEHPEAKIMGLFIVLQAQEFRSRQFVPAYTQLGLRLTLVGYTPGGHQMRVEWFPDASVE